MTSNDLVTYLILAPFMLVLLGFVYNAFTSGANSRADQALQQLKIEEARRLRAEKELAALREKHPTATRPASCPSCIHRDGRVEPGTRCEVCGRLIFSDMRFN